MRVNLPIYQYDLQTIKTNIEKFIAETKSIINEICNRRNVTWDNLIAPIQNILAEFEERFSNPISLTHTLTSNNDSGDIYSFLQEKDIELEKLIFNNNRLHSAFCNLKKSQEYNHLTAAQKKTIDHIENEFKTNGINLPEDKREQLTQIKKELSLLTGEFQRLNQKQAECHRLFIENEDALAYLPQATLQEGRENAAKESKNGILLPTNTLFQHSKYIRNTTLREKIFKEFIGLAFSNAKNGAYRDKTPLIEVIMQNRLKLAKLFGLKNYAELALDNKAFKDPVQIISFLMEAYKKLKPYETEEEQKLADFAKVHLNIEKLQPWDYAFAEYEFEKHFIKTAEEKYFLQYDEKTVWSHLVYSLNKLYQLTLTPFHTDTWHPDVKCFQVTDQANQPIGILYFDLYVRPNKRSSGAWTSPVMTRRKLDNSNTQLPVAIVACNFTPPTSDGEIYYNRDDITTLFHETGHAMQHILTQIDNHLISGFRGVPWDMIEVPSLFFEHWADKGNLSQLVPPLFPVKYITSAARQYLQDLTLHYEYQGDGAYETLAAVSQFLDIPLCNRMDTNTHVFGSISSAYGSCEYTYLLSKSIAALLYAPFQEFGAFDNDLGERLKETFLQQGGSKDPLEMFGDFLGIDPHTFEPKHKQQKVNGETAKTNHNAKNKMQFFAEKISGQRRTREQSTQETTARPGL